jgi:pimeloyl-ACP methyl ester carboxylesterase
MLTAVGPDLFAQRFGKAPARVLGLPGWMRSRTDLEAVLAGFDALAVDLPGFGGASPPPATATGAAGYAALVAPALDACAPEVIILGHSFGGRVAVHLAAAHPHRVGGLVLTGVPRLVKPTSTRRRSLRFRLARWRHRHGLVSDEGMETRRLRHGSADYRAASGVMRGVLVSAVNEDYEDVLSQVHCPTTLVWADDDTAAPLVDAQRAVDHFAGGATLTIVPGAGHFTPRTAAAELRAAIDLQLR